MIYFSEECVILPLSLQKEQWKSSGEVNMQMQMVPVHWASVWPELAQYPHQGNTLVSPCLWAIIVSPYMSHVSVLHSLPGLCTLVSLGKTWTAWAVWSGEDYRMSNVPTSRWEIFAEEMLELWQMCSGTPGKFGVSDSATSSRVRMAEFVAQRFVAHQIWISRKQRAHPVPVPCMFVLLYTLGQAFQVNVWHTSVGPSHVLWYFRTSCAPGSCVMAAFVPGNPRQKHVNSCQKHKPTPMTDEAVGLGLLAINILRVLFGKASDFSMTLSHQRLSMQLALAAVRHLKSSMCFSALINQGRAETNLKIKNIQKVEGKTIAAFSHAIAPGPHVTQLFCLTTILCTPVMWLPVRG